MDFITVDYEKSKAADSGLAFTPEMLVNALTERGWHIATAESCTGGLVADGIVSVSGASAVFDGGAVCYANRIKQSLLGVCAQTLSEKGAVSPECAQEMAVGIRQTMQSELGLATTGIAGPSGGTPEKPVGLVYVGVSTKKKTTVYRLHLSGNRAKIRNSAAKIALRIAFWETVTEKSSI